MVDALTKLLFPLADVLRMNLREDRGRLSGATVIEVRVRPGVTLMLNPKVVGSFIDREAAESGALVHVRGHLHALVMVNGNTDVTTAALVDGGALGIALADCGKPVNLPKGINAAYGWAKPGLAAMFDRNVNSTEWREVPA